MRGLTGRRGADFVSDCVGSSRTIRDMWSMTRRGGTAIVVGIGGKGRHGVVQRAGAVLLRAHAAGLCRRLARPCRRHARFFNWVRSGDLDLRKLVTGAGTLTDVDRTLDELAAGRGIRTTLRPGRDA